ncbi:MAG: cytochrome P460 family protein [Geminicoccaceae bacterium]
MARVLSVCVTVMVTLFAATTETSAQDLIHPEEHFQAPNPADVDGQEATSIYAGLAARMIDGYALSKDDAALSYRGWPRYNSSPFRSATHGERYVNVYANARASDYGLFEEAAPLPEGAIIAKDSFTVTEDGRTYPGPLFVMEKMAEGFDERSGDWRYAMIMPDGSFIGESLRANDRSMDFCVECHAAVGAEQDHLFFMPADVRVEGP